MIVRHNICDFCEREQKIIPEYSGIEMIIDIGPAGKVSFMFTDQMVKRTFCGRKCLFDFLESYVDEEGFLSEELKNA